MIEPRDETLERLRQLSKEFDKLLGITENTEIHNYESNLDRLVRFGFTLDEAKAFLGHEPNYIRRKVTDDESDDKVPEP